MPGDPVHGDAAPRDPVCGDAAPVRLRPLTFTELGGMLRATARGVFPAADRSVWVAPLCGPAAAVVRFTGCHVVATPVETDWWRAVLSDDDDDPLHPRVLGTLAERLGSVAGESELVLVASPAPTVSPAPPVRLVPFDDGHPRLSSARRYRDDVQAWSTVEGDGLLVLGRGLGGRWEMSIDVIPCARTRGLGRALAAAARTRVPRGEPVFAQVSPGNAAALSALRSSGYRPIAHEVLVPLRPAEG